MRRIHLDHNSTSPLRPEVRELLSALLAEPLGNPSSVHASGRRARELVDGARARVAAALGVAEEEIAFTSGGTEANNLALLGGLGARTPAGGRPPGLVTTAVEHSSVLGPAEALERRGHAVLRLRPDARGRVAPGELLDAVGRGGVGLVSVQAANNEVGTLQSLSEIGAGLAGLARDRRPVFHSDAVQALGKVPLDLAGWRLDLASFSAHKVGGPPGVGVLYRRRGLAVAPQVHGGGQEGGLRPGTEPAAAIAAAALAIELAVAEQPAFARRTAALARGLWKCVERAVPGVVLAGPRIDSAERLPNTLNLLFPNSDGKMLVMRLDLDGLEVSAGSACASGSIEPSHVLLAMGMSADRARAGLRLSLGRETEVEECRRAVEILQNASASSHASLGALGAS